MVIIFGIGKDLLQLLLARVINVGRLSFNRLIGLLEIKLQAFSILLLDCHEIFSFLAWLDWTATSGARDLWSFIYLNQIICFLISVDCFEI